jgi:uncharacterized membrane protein
MGVGSDMRSVGAALTTLARVLVLVASTLPWAAALAGPPWSSDLACSLASFCHQRIDRTLVLFTVPMAVCSRCVGVFSGFGFGALFPMRRVSLHHGVAICLVASLAAMTDVATQDLGWHPPWHLVRVVTGLGLGWSAMSFFVGTVLALNMPPERS